MNWPNFGAESLAAWTQRVADVARSLNAPISAKAVAGLCYWIEQLAAWNSKIDLTAARTSDELVDLCVADALVLATHVAEGARAVDVGTGAGAPGLALAILRPDVRVTLVEPLGKRVAFLRAVIGGLGLRTEVLKTRGSGVVPSTFDVAISRATLAPDAWLQLGLQLVHDQGAVGVLLARDLPPQSTEATMTHGHSYDWPLTKVARKLQWYQPVTPSQKHTP